MHKLAKHLRITSYNVCYTKLLRDNLAGFAKEFYADQARGDIEPI